MILDLDKKTLDCLAEASAIATHHYGNEKQMLVCVEEMAELTKEILKLVNRGMANRGEIVGEIADVLFTITNLMSILGVSEDEIGTQIEIKAKRLLTKINLEMEAKQ